MVLNNLTKVTRQVANLTAADVGALAADAQAADALLLGGLTKDQVVAQAKTGVVPDTRTVNGHALTTDVTLSHSDVGAAPLSHSHDYVPNSAKGTASGVATLDAEGKIPQSQLPAIAINDTFGVESEAEMLALTAQVGDMAIRSDVSETFVLAAQPATDLANWKKFLTPTADVVSVNGQKGAVTLGAADVGAEPAFDKNTAFNKNFGTTANTVMQGDDSRVANAVPNTRTINGQALSADVTLDAASVGALAENAKAADSALFDGSTKAEVIASARSGLAEAGASYSKSESDAKYQDAATLGAAIQDLIRTVDITPIEGSATVTVPENTISTILFLSVSGVVQVSGAWEFAGGVITFGEALTADDKVTVIGFK